MKKYILYPLMLLTILFLSACSNSTEPKEENDVQSMKDVAIKIPENIFSSSKKNETINEDEMKQSIKNYIDYNWELSENIIPLSSALSDENVTESDREKLQKLIDLAQQNDANFDNFISNNTIPDDYKKPSKEIYEFISSSTALSVELDQELDKLAQDGNLFKTDFSFTKRFEKVNGRKQKEIEKFLNEKNIKTSINSNKKN
ncbi:NDxxF motif lipoprotein [Bacillus toyonensis]|uniref:NDxxF motif lipoprotein n=1 Tax=Bacillus thuringiensis TaxID=1428 RepID=UPI001BCDF5E5|nr:NDxxF motif lipoprotein [Bacillus toyonensis]MDA1763909.1 NDxxF motif lipoprotein [Bacillus cereus]